MLNPEACSKDKIDLYCAIAMTASLAEFRATLKLTCSDPDGLGEKVFSYWNNQDVTYESCDRAEVLHIARMNDGTFHLEIANLHHVGTLEQLEEILYAWAQDEGWFD
jgi:hypothetical protein